MTGFHRKTIRRAPKCSPQGQPASRQTGDAGGGQMTRGPHRETIVVLRAKWAGRANGVVICKIKRASRVATTYARTGRKAATTWAENAVLWRRQPNTTSSLTPSLFSAYLRTKGKVPSAPGLLPPPSTLSARSIKRALRRGRRATSSSAAEEREWRREIARGVALAPQWAQHYRPPDHVSAHIAAPPRHKGGERRRVSVSTTTAEREPRQ